MYDEKKNIEDIERLIRKIHHETALNDFLKKSIGVWFDLRGGNMSNLDMNGRILDEVIK
jgi:hypothetical protein